MTDIQTGYRQDGFGSRSSLPTVIPTLHWLVNLASQQGNLVCIGLYVVTAKLLVVPELTHLKVAWVSLNYTAVCM